MEEFVKIFKVLTDRNRIRILKLLEQKELCVCEITGILGISTSTVSSHISILNEAGYISVRKKGKWVYIKIRRSSDNPVLHQLLAMMPGWLNNDEIVLSDTNKVNLVDKEILCSG